MPQLPSSPKHAVSDRYLWPMTACRPDSRALRQCPLPRIRCPGRRVLLRPRRGLFRQRTTKKRPCDSTGTFFVFRAGKDQRSTRPGSAGQRMPSSRGTAGGSSPSTLTKRKRPLDFDGEAVLPLPFHGIGRGSGHGGQLRRDLGGGKARIGGHHHGYGRPVVFMLEQQCCSGPGRVLLHDAPALRQREKDTGHFLFRRQRRNGQQQDQQACQQYFLHLRLLDSDGKALPPAKGPGMAHNVSSGARPFVSDRPPSQARRGRPLSRRFP